ncbi:CHAT domain-containing tetratricopeptide repeat protein [Fibrella arboris]|uniref:CHAT domain-containing tetratricopeptide repeat protein n=1 Tax=Fibrella arboris TaxID=3242486 RepID=UPI00352240EF
MTRKRTTGSCRQVIWFLAGWLMSLSVQAQQLAENRMDSLLVAEQYTEAEPLVRQLLTARIRSGDTTTTDYTQLIEHLVWLYKSRRQFTRADSCLQVALRVVRRLAGYSRLPEYGVYQRIQAVLYRSMGKRDLANAWFHKTVDWAQQTIPQQVALVGVNHKQTVQTQVILGQCQYDLGSYAEAVSTLKTAIDGFRRTGDTTTIHYTNGLNLLGLAYGGQAQYARADSCYDALMRAVKWVPRYNQHSDYGAYLINRATFLAEGTQPERAVYWYREAVAQLASVPGKNHPDYAGALRSLATSLKGAKAYPERITLLTEAIARQESLGDTLTIDYCDAYNSLAITYGNQRKYARADSCFALLLQKVTNVPSYTSLDSYGTYLINRAVYLRFNRQLQQAIYWYEKGLTQQALAPGKSSPNYAYHISKLANSYEQLRDFIKADSLYRYAIVSVDWQVSPDPAERADYQSDLANLCRVRGHYQEADSLFRKSLPVLEQAWGPKSLDLARQYNQVGVLHEAMNRYASAIADYSRAVQLCEANAPDEVPDNYDTYLSNLAGVYMTRYQFDLAMPLYRRALLASEKSYGPASKQYARRVFDIGDCFESMGQYDSAGVYFQRSIELARRQPMDRTNTQYSLFVSYLASLYRTTGQYARAEALQEELLARKISWYGANHVDLVQNLLNMASLYRTMGLSEQAVVRLKQALAIESSQNGQTSLLGRLLGELAINYEQLDSLEQADRAYRQGISVVRNTTGTTHLAYASMVGNWADFLVKRKQFTGVDSLFQTAMTSQIALVGAQSREVSNTLNVWTNRHLRGGNSRLADSLARQLLHLRTTLYGTHHPATQVAQYKLVRALFLSDRWAEARQLLWQTFDLMRQTVERNLMYLSAEQQEGFFAEQSELLPLHYSYALRQAQTDSTAAALAYSVRTYANQRLLTEIRDLLTTASQHPDPVVRQALGQLTSLRQRVAALAGKPIEQQQQGGLDTLIHQAEALAKTLARQSAAFREATILVQQTGWTAVRDALKPGEAAVEFVRFPYHTGRQQTDSLLYVALVLRHRDTRPHLVYLTHETPLRRLLTRPGLNSPEGLSLRASRYQQRNKALPDADSLYSLIWQPLDSLLTNSHTIWLSPDGLLHQVAFSALQPPGTAAARYPYLANRYELRYVGSTQQIATVRKRAASTYQTNWSAVLYGGIQYNDQSAARPADSPAARQRFRSVATPGASWAFLPGTEREIRAIRPQLGSNTTLVTGNQATEKQLKSLSDRAPDILHIATHGFVRQSPTELHRHAGSLLLQSGLVMAGANQHDYATSADDGLLTAYEVSVMNLRRTKLVVLSACETGLGSTLGSEGVIGLRRAFQLAGAGAVITSIWPVADLPTSDFMTLFYRNWTKYKDLHTAFASTQRDFRQQYPPAVWAAFVLVE